MVELRQLPRQPGGMRWLDAGLCSLEEKLLQAFMGEGLDHLVLSVSRIVTRCNTAQFG